MALIGKQGRVLVVGRSENDTRLLRNILRLQFELDVVSNTVNLNSRLDAFDPQVVVLDSNISFDYVRRIREMDAVRGEFTGIVLLTSVNDPESLCKGVRSGVDSFCNWEHIEEQLSASVELTLKLSIATDELKIYSQKLLTANAELQKLSITDELTGLYNMRFINQRLEEEFDKAVRYKRNLALLMIDIDRFKEVNDNADHLLGSYVIGEVGRDIQRMIRTTDLAGRYGGDEFIVVFPETGAEVVQGICERLHEVIRKRVYDNGFDMTKITISQGFAAIQPAIEPPPANVSDFLRMADRSLFQAKENGRDAIVGYNEPPKKIKVG